MNNCKNCKFYNPKQAALAYESFKGFCNSPMLEFNITDGTMLSVLDRNNIHPTHQDGTYAFENIKSFLGAKRSGKRYALVVSEDFGCVKFTKNEEDTTQQD